MSLPRGTDLHYAKNVNDHYFSNSDAATPAEQHLLHLNLRGHDAQMWVSDRVFSAQRLDIGTEQLLHALPPLPAQGNILDLGCGWGPIAVGCGLESPEAKVWAVDVNDRALALCQQNAEINGAGNVHALRPGDALAEVEAADIRFRAIVSNPPVRIGKKAMHELLLTWLPYLEPDGDAWFVMGKNLGADSFLKWLEAQGFRADKYSSRKGFRIIHARQRLVK